MIDWNPLVAATGLLIAAVAAIIPSLVVIVQHNETRGNIAANSETLSRVESNTNGTLKETQAAIISLRAEVARQAAIIGQLDATLKGKGEAS